MIIDYYNEFTSRGGTGPAPPGVTVPGAGYEAASNYITGSKLGLVSLSDPSLNNSRNAFLELVKGNTINCTFIGERDFEGGPQQNEVRALTVNSVTTDIPRGETTSTGEIIWVFVNENPGIRGYGTIKRIELPTPVVRVPSGLKPNTLYNY